MRSLALALAAALALAGCGSQANSQGGGLASASPAPSATASTADCVALAAIAPIAVPPLEIADLADGTKRVASAEGGYSVVVPKTWLVSGSFGGGPEAAFAQAHISSYDPRAAPTSAPEAGGMLPPEVGIRFDIELWVNPSGESLDMFAQRVHIGPDQVAILPGTSVVIDGRRAYRTTIQDDRRFQADRLITTRQTRALWLVETTRPDRLLVLYATPAESSLLPLVERAVATMRLTSPTSAVLPVTVQRSELLHQWLYDKSGARIPGRRVEAKLMTFAEAGAALNPGGGGAPTPSGLYRLDTDLDELFWLVAVSGPDLPQGRGGPAGLGTPPTTKYILYTAPATTDRMAMTGAAYSSAGVWPPQFDGLPDRCR